MVGFPRKNLQTFPGWPKKAKQSESFLSCDHVFMYLCLLNIWGEINRLTSLYLYSTNRPELCVGSLIQKICFLFLDLQIRVLKSTKISGERICIFRRAFDEFYLLILLFRWSLAHATRKTKKTQTSRPGCSFSFLPFGRQISPHSDADCSAVADVRKRSPSSAV